MITLLTFCDKNKIEFKESIHFKRLLLFTSFNLLIFSGVCSCTFWQVKTVFVSGQIAEP